MYLQIPFFLNHFDAAVHKAAIVRIPFTAKQPLFAGVVNQLGCWAMCDCYSQLLSQEHSSQLQYCQPCGFPPNLGLFFFRSCAFLTTCGLLVFGLVLLYGTFAVSFHFTAKRNLVVFCVNLLILGLFFSHFPSGFVFN